MMAEQGIAVDHSTINHWAIHLLLVVETLSRKHKSKICTRWRMNEAYIEVKSLWEYL